VLFPKTLLVAGYGKNGQLLMAHYHRADADTPDWDLKFFEHDFINEKLLGVPQQVKTIFIGNEESLIVPMELYNEKAAQDWLKSIYALSPRMVVYTQFLKSAEAHYLFGVPGELDKLLHRYFGSPKMLPAAAFHFHKPERAIPNLLQLLITQDKAIATLQQNGDLKWHRHFEFSNAEDLAFQAANLCREMHIPRIDLQIECAMLCEDCDDVALELERYFPKIKWTNAHALSEIANEHLVFLALRLYACAL
ncbi:MAG: DUF3822 family protein, partial [Chitinophagaceae bacterium]